MPRAWPFEDKPDETEPVRDPQDYVDRAGEGTEAVIIRIGLRDVQLVLVDARGGWRRWVYPSMEAAEAAAKSLAIPVHVGQYPEATRLRMNTRRRTANEFESGAYPEQGEVGPVIPYRENRPRQTDPREARGASAKGA